MSLFQYRAITEKGKKIQGLVEAEYLQEAQGKLSEEKLILLNISSVKSRNLSKNISQKEILHFTRELAKLLSASLPLYDSLLALEEKYRHKKIHPIILSLCDKVKSGSSFSEALKTFPQTFDVLYVAIIANAEKTGSLASSLNEVASILNNQLTLKKQVISTLTYPCILTAFCFVVLISLFFFVIPALSDLFEDRQVHFFTKIILQISRWLNEQKIIFLTGFTLFLTSLGLFFTTKYFKIRFQKIILKTPLIGVFLKKIALIRFCRALSALLEGGISFVYALKSARKVMNHLYLEKIFEEIEKKVLEGLSFSEQLENLTEIPSFMARMISIAEKSGNLPFILKQISEIEQDDLSKLLSHLTTLAQPIILLVLGAVVGLVLLAVLLPLTDVSAFMNP